MSKCAGLVGERGKEERNPTPTPRGYRQLLSRPSPTPVLGSHYRYCVLQPGKCATLGVPLLISKIGIPLLVECPVSHVRGLAGMRVSGPQRRGVLGTKERKARISYQVHVCFEPPSSAARVNVIAPHTPDWRGGRSCGINVSNKVRGGEPHIPLSTYASSDKPGGMVCWIEML